MSPKGPVKLVCFDLGGVLVRYHIEWVDRCRAAGLEVRGDTAGAIAEHARRAITEAHMRGEITVDQWVSQVTGALGGIYAPAELAALHEAVLIDEYPGVGALIDDLHRAGVATACLSNTNDAHWAALLHRDGAAPMPGEPRYPGVQRLGAHYASHLMQLTKPSPEIYRAFEESTGYSGKQILFFDDLAENIAAARALGWQAEIIDATRPTDEQMRRWLAAHGVL